MSGETFVLPVVGDVLGNWRVIGFLGDGRSGMVFKVHETCGARRIGALKIFKGPFTDDRRKSLEDEINFVERQIIPGFIPSFYGRGQWNEHPFFVMQFAEAVPGELSKRRTRRIMNEAAAALTQLHSRRYLHCDIKRENLGIIDGHVVLLDFGSARPMAEADETPTRVGTWVLMAPEVREKIQLDVRSDIYSLGATLNRICSRSARRTFDDLILHAMANDPDDRPQTVEEFRRELNAAQDRLVKFNNIFRWLAAVLVLGILMYIVSLINYAKHRVTSTKEMDRQYIEMEANLSTAVEYIKQGKYDKARDYLKPIAESNCLRSRQAQQMLDDLSRRGSRQKSGKVQSGSPMQ